MSGHATQNLVSPRKKLSLFVVSSEYKDLGKFSEDTDSHLIREELEEERYYSLQTLKPKTIYPNASTKQKSNETSKKDRPTKRPMAGHKGTQQYNSPSTWAELKKQSSRKIHYKN